MNVVPYGISREQRAQPEGRPLKSVILYEDFAAGWWARHVFDRAIRTLSYRIEVTVHMRRFDLLPGAGVGADGEADFAADHDIVMLSASNIRGLPTPVCDWLETWIAGRKQGPNLLILSSPTATDDLAGADAVLTFLRQLAGRGAVDLMVHSSLCPAVPGRSQPGGDPPFKL